MKKKNFSDYQKDLTKKKVTKNFFEPEFLKCKTKFILTSKCHMSKYDQIMN